MCFLAARNRVQGSRLIVEGSGLSVRDVDFNESSRVCLLHMSGKPERSAQASLQVV